MCGALPGDHAALDAAVDLEHLSTQSFRDEPAGLRVQALGNSDDRARVVSADALAPDKLGQLAQRRSIAEHHGGLVTVKFRQEPLRGLIEAQLAPSRPAGDFNFRLSRNPLSSGTQSPYGER